MAHEVLAEGERVGEAEWAHGTLEHEGGGVNIHGVGSPPAVVAVLHMGVQGILAGELLAAHITRQLLHLRTRSDRALSKSYTHHTTASPPEDTVRQSTVKELHTSHNSLST